MSVEEAEAYAATHNITERLEAALNAVLAELPSDPFKSMASHLRAKGDLGERPTANADAKLRDDVSAYLATHDLMSVLNSVVTAVLADLPADPLDFMATKLEASGGSAASAYGTVADVRSAFVDYFVKNAAHTHWASSPVVPHDDPTLLFINAGMNQFKPLFLGRCQEGTAMSKLKRACNSQKCIRAGGKHNDLDDVGFDNYHHTFFEMLGNWSFGDYFKEDAIKWAWTLLTEVYQIPAERLYVTYFEGNEAMGVPADTEARDIWLKYVPAERILTGNTKDNFWEMGDTGPCGPCSEIHYDRIGGRDAAHLVNDGCVGRNGNPIPPKGTILHDGHEVGVADPNVLEIWNNVFMQFNREKDGSLTPLPAPCVDTGMGLERVSSILLGKTSNYEIDAFTKLFDAIHALVPSAPAYKDLYGDADVGDVFMAYRVIADHIRTLTFAITDGAMPSNEGRGYVLRRILRRAVRYGSEKLKAPVGFFHKLVDTLVEILGDAFPELRKDPAAVKAVIKEEEEIFSRTLTKGIAELDKRCKKLSKGDQLPGEDAFKMYDTYGFPLDLTVLMCEEKGMTVDTEGYEKEMAASRLKAKEGGHFSDVAVIDMAADEVDTLKTKMGVPPTDDAPKWTWDSVSGTGAPLETKLRGAINTKKAFLESVSADDGLVGLVTESTPYYAEAGGQVADVGTIASGGASFVVEDVKKVGPYVLHIGKVTSGSIALGADVTLSVDYAKRAPTAKNHTSTHMLNLALWGALGQQCDQRGSLCDGDKLRFDFAYGKPLTEAQLQDAQDRVNAQIDQALPVQIQVAPLEAAKAVNGLRAVFGEQYPDPVRVVTVGGPGVQQMIDAPTNGEWANLSTEFCGGTHIANSSEAKKFALLSEEGLGRGVRRVLGVTHAKAEEAFAEAEKLKSRADAASKLTGPELAAEAGELVRLLESAVIPAVDKKRLLDATMALKKKMMDADKGKAKANAGAAKAEAESLAEGGSAGVPIIKLLSTEADAKSLETAVAAAVAKQPEAPILLIGAGKSLAALAVVPASMQEKLSAKDWVNEALQAVGGKGGGKPARAQGQARDPSNGGAAEAAAKAFAAKQLSIEIS